MEIDFNKYAELPDSMNQESVLALFTELLDFLDAESRWDRDDVVDALYELADRQWHTYSLLNPDLRNRVERWIFENWCVDEVPFVESVTGIVPLLGLKNVVKLFEQTLNESLNQDVREELQCALEEYGENVGNPYAEIRGGNEPSGES